MTAKVMRLFVEKKPGFDVEAQSFLKDLKGNLGIAGLEKVRIINRYDMAGITEVEYALARNTIFSEPPVDNVYDEVFEVKAAHRVFAMEFLPGQYDQRADSAAQCIQILSQKDKPTILSAKLVVLEGVISEQDFLLIKGYLINPVESREAMLEKPKSLEQKFQAPPMVQILEGFIAMSHDELVSFVNENGLAMTIEDLEFIQNYFKNTEKRNPTITELKVIDTYWSDHCRHTTFFTKINNVQFAEEPSCQPIRQAYEEYLTSRAFVYEDRQRDVCLMDLAIMGMKELKKQGRLKDLDESDEINACSIVVDADIDGKTEPWLVMFKNETHNHPTEIEPFGGAATCLGGCIRDPLSGRSYVYQAMRVTGSADPRSKVEDTLPGKLPQRKITTGAAAGYSSYGNQIGLATGHVAEVYDEDFVAKRMEIGAVIAAAPKSNVQRLNPEAGDVVILLGGKTGRDGCGGATGSSKEHTEESLVNCGAEVQKGNAPEERKIQRLFRNPQVSTMIKKCNDFGAGGVSVAIGELTEGLEINLDAVPKKYEGLDGTELAISESQERMAVVISAENVEGFISEAQKENLEATPVAQVTDDRRLKMCWHGQAIVDISRDFLDTNGVKQETDVFVLAPDSEKSFFESTINPIDITQAWLENLKDLNTCSQKGLVEMFDSTIGAGTVLMPFGGKYQATPTEGMVAKLPVLNGDTTTGTIMTYGYNPKLAKWSPFHGALYAIVESVAKVVVLGGQYETIRLTLQEYFEKLGKDQSKWGKPFSALLGAFYAQKQLGIPAIGGKDSMSGTFKDINVPPTLVSFAVDTINVKHATSQEFKATNSMLVLVPVIRDENQLPDFNILKNNFAKISELIKKDLVLSAHTVKAGGVAEAISKMAFGNRIGVKLESVIDIKTLFSPDYGSIILELPQGTDLATAFGQVKYVILGSTQDKKVIEVNGQQICLEEAFEAWESPLEKIFSTKTAMVEEKPMQISYSPKEMRKSAVSIAKPRVFIPIFPGTNCEYDSAKAFEGAGAISETLVFKNLTPKAIEESVEAMIKAINNSQIIMIPGGFSAGDEPEGSGKFIATVFRNPKIKEAVMKLLKERDGLMLGICNGFQALVKLGLVPYGEIIDMIEASPTLTHNKIGRHVSSMVQTKIVSKLSPWFNNVQLGDIHTIAVSHGEGRFVANEEVIKNMADNGQIATQYVDLQGNPTYDNRFCPNFSIEAIEGITSPDGRVLGKMGHSERIGTNLYKNIPGEKDQKLFAAGVAYFK